MYLLACICSLVFAVQPLHYQSIVMELGAQLMGASRPVYQRAVSGAPLARAGIGISPIQGIPRSLPPPSHLFMYSPSDRRSPSGV
jgi:hypothetical protein